MTGYIVATDATAAKACNYFFTVTMFTLLYNLYVFPNDEQCAQCTTSSSAVADEPRCITANRKILKQLRNHNHAPLWVIHCMPSFC